MEFKYQHPANGDELRRQDVNLISDNAALADDRTLWELLRSLPGSATPDKLIIPYANRSWTKLSGSSSNALVWGNSANGSVRVNPFRAIVGSTTLVGTSPIEHMRGQRSGYFVGSSNLYSTVGIAANASGNPRWTLVYAAVTPDANGDTATIVNKDPTTKVVSSATRVYTKRTTVTVTTTDGTPAASPTRPSLPSDGAGTYFIALAYVYVPDGFGASSTVLRQYIHEAAPCALLSPTSGGRNLAPANQQHVVGGTVDTRQSGSSATTRPGAYLPSTMVGGESRLILLQLGRSPASHQDGDVVENSVDWRFRYFRYQIIGKSGSASTAAFASDRGATGALPAGTVFADAFGNTHGGNSWYGHGQSFVADSASVISAADDNGVALYVTDTRMSVLQATSAVQLYVRNTDGALVFRQSGTPNVQLIIWLEATGPYSNFGTI